MLELEEAKASFQREKSELEEHGGDSRGLKFVPPPKRKGLAGGGSLAAAGACAAQAQNRGAFVAVEPELDGILAWLAQESVVDSAVPGKLWDNITWDRPVMSNARNFEIKDPFFAFLAGGHLPELLKKLQHDLWTPAAPHSGRQGSWTRSSTSATKSRRRATCRMACTSKPSTTAS